MSEGQKIGEVFLYLKKENGELEAVGTVSETLEIGVDYANDKDQTFPRVEMTNGEVTFDLKLVLGRKYHKTRKGKRYIYTYYEEFNFCDDFFEKVLGIKNNNKKVGKVGGKIKWKIMN